MDFTELGQVYEVSFLLSKILSKGRWPSLEPLESDWVIIGLI